MPEWSFDFTSRIRKINKRPIKVEKQLREDTCDSFGVRHVLTLARYLDTDEEVMLKIRYDLDPKTYDIEDVEENREEVEQDFWNEIDGVNIVHEIGHGPGYIDHVSQPAGPRFPYPNGWVDFIVMSRVPGENLEDIYRGLSRDQLESIREQLAFIFEHMRQNCAALGIQNPRFLQYDRQNDKVYIVDFSSLCIIDPSHPSSKPITVNDAWVLEFGMWPKSHFEPLQ
ncbi:hypothetical protein ASPWEDRAFT_176334 [Aspergillus wentii DTO 134E9]|uniref:Protein kinase domain-containing protein n=1 Tax=Aspergillus wentii DTO 134E9 TaxID=1073089 RepID=A0A1L9R8L7_ASPWE|nr:uncharacterized protein ASPWEDRAFT_176334 [Aspergillus wentii DTO 134E9]OJJ31244.1 hypothetical protein ASPWEDRAFT_176334 [Aspergillus wentii DTO 134E9]